MAINITSWGISVGNNASTNTDKWKQNIQADLDVYLPVDPGGKPYKFNNINIHGLDNVTFFGKPDNNGNLPTIKFINRAVLEIKNADSFTIRDLIFDGREADNEGGVWVRNGSTNGTLKNLEIREADEVSCVISGQGTHHVTVEDCTVHGQRHWSGNAKAMFLAGGYAEHITFKNCKTFSQHHYNEENYSPADHYDSDNATNVEYHNCTADGRYDGNNIITDDDKGTGFWNEAGHDEKDDHETSSTYYGCTAIKTAGGLAASENSSVEAHNCYL